MNKAITRRILLATISTACISLCGVQAFGQQDEVANTASESPIRWQYTAPINIPPNATSERIDTILTPEIFDGARYDLHDLRVYTATGAEVPYALRVRSMRSERQALEAREFNNTEGPDQSSELSLDLGDGRSEHNAIDIQLPGQNYRRQFKLEGSNDGEQWGILQEQAIVDFRRGEKMVRDQVIEYPVSRYRYLRVKFYRDPLIDKQRVPINEVKVLRTVEVPGEQLKMVAKVGNREAVPADGGPGSRWVCDLGGDQTPVSSIEVQISDEAFVRNFRIEAGGPEGSGADFRTIATGVWQRRGGEPIKPMRSEFPETRAARLRLIVTDHRNQPLQIDQIQFAADARQIVIASLEAGETCQLYFGNPDAADPNYDFGRNLPQRLTPEPARATLGARTTNPNFEPEPLPLTERLPWLIYVVLGVACVVLAAIAFSLSRTAIAAHDSVDATTA